MIRLQWNGLRVGHHVLVHDETERGMPLVPGRVTMIKSASGIESGSNDVSILISPPGRASKVVSPRRLAVHLDELDPAERCWRCENDTTTDGSPRRNAAPTKSTNKPTHDRNDHA